VTSPFAESVVEDAALAWLGALGYVVLHGPDIAAGMPGAERSDSNYRHLVLEGRLRQALVRPNPDLLHEALEKCALRVDAHQRARRQWGRRHD
jgi:type I restriction enzyme R subunit